ncbi:hypothetical protein DL93DRAFT_2162575 [Clavulina sp. PMI_390]|nr:hypothetical protein DL93DRAFT_2162575 [Clavulina sp. PMI_390]
MSDAVEVDPIDNYTMSLAPGSAVFVVQGVRFRIPKALLQQNSEVLAWMFNETRGSDDEAINLDDPLEAFEDLVAMLLNPLESCLNHKLPIARDLRRLLNLLVILRKYLIDKLAAYVLELVEPLIKPKTLPKHLNEHFTTVDIIRIAHHIDDKSLAKTARRIFLDSVWTRQSTIPSIDMLRLGQELSDNEVIGAAYYQILLLGRDAWDGLDLSVDEQKTLLNAMNSCGDKAQRFTLSLADGLAETDRDPLADSCCGNAHRYDSSYAGNRLSQFCTLLGQQKLRWFDYVGRVFQDMLQGSSGSNEEPIVLDDELEPFQDLCTTLLTPLKSCLNTGLPIAKDFKRLMRLLNILHKYQMHEYETHVGDLLLPLTHVNTLKPLLNEHLSAIDIIRLADRVGRNKIAKGARTILLEQLWSGQPAAWLVVVLRLGQEIRDRLIIGGALYQILLLGRDAWQTLDLTKEERNILLEGMIRCGEIKDQIMNSLGSDPTASDRNYFVHTCCFNATDAFTPNTLSPYGLGARPLPHRSVSYIQPSSWPRIKQLLQDISSQKPKPYDVIGFMQLVAKNGCNSSTCPKTYLQEIQAFKSNLYSIFYSSNDVIPLY